MGGQVIAACFEKKCVVASVCHGPNAFAKAMLNGEPIIKGKKVTGFSNAEEEAVGLTSKVPFLLQDKLTELGGIYSNKDPWTSYAVADGKLVTGQNPQSSVECAKKALNATRKALIVTTSATDFAGQKTGAWSEEVTGPFYVFKDAGCDVSICSISGGDVPIDQGSLSETFITESDKRMAAENNVALKGVPKLAAMDAASFDIVFFAGGHGTCVDFPTEELGQVIAACFEKNRVVASVCHGPNCLVKAMVNGEPVIKGKRVTGFSKAEEEILGLTLKVPFLLQDKLTELGGIYSNGDPWSHYAVADGKLVTGQNPQSSVVCAKKALDAS